MRGNNLLGQVAKQVGGIAKHAVKRVVAEPLEVLKNATGQSDNQAMEAVEQGGPTTAQGDDAGGPSGFKTQQDYQKYQQLSGNRDQLELNLLRKRLAAEWGVERGMEAARSEWEQKEKQRKQVEEREEEEKKYVKFEKKKTENAQVAMAKQAASAEKRLSVAG